MVLATEMFCFAARFVAGIPGEILDARIFASRRDSQQDPENLAIRNFASQRESCQDPDGSKNVLGKVTTEKSQK